MKPIKLMSYAEGRWIEPAGALNDIASAVTDEPVAQVRQGIRDFAGIFDRARQPATSAPRRTRETSHRRERRSAWADGLLLFRLNRN